MFRNIYILPGVPALLKKKFMSIAERFRAQEILLERVYLSVDESVFADVLAEVVLAHPDVEIGSYPRFEETSYRVVLIAEARDADALADAVTEMKQALAAWLVELAPESNADL